MLSYHYVRRLDLAAALPDHFGTSAPELFADSGAFSAATVGASVDIDAYADWLLQHHRLFVAYANLDVIGDPDATWQNQQRLEAKGLQPLPVFHAGEPWAWLDRYLEAGYRWIGLGGLVGHPFRFQMPWLVECFRRSRGRAVFHGFGLVRWRALADLPWYSVDSSTWGAAFRWGKPMVFDPALGRFLQIEVGQHQQVYAAASLIRSYGYDPADFAERARSSRAQLCGITAASIVRAERWLRHHHGDIQIPGNAEATPGVKVFLVDVGLKDTSTAHEQGQYRGGLVPT